MAPPLRRPGEQLAGDGRAAGLAAVNSVPAHVPDFNDFVAGFAAILEPAGVATFEFPHLLHLLARVRFDTIYVVTAMPSLSIA